jgi:hypothetical protein
LLTQESEPIGQQFGLNGHSQLRLKGQLCDAIAAIAAVIEHFYASIVLQSKTPPLA